MFIVTMSLNVLTFARNGPVRLVVPLTLRTCVVVVTDTTAFPNVTYFTTVIPPTEYIDESLVDVKLAVPKVELGARKVFPTEREPAIPIPPAVVRLPVSGLVLSIVDVTMTVFIVDT